MKDNADAPSEVERRRSTFGARLRGFRAAAGISGPKLADRSGIAQSQISRIERGQVTPHESSVASLLDAMGVSAADREDVLQELRTMRSEYASWQLLTEPGGGGRRQHELARIESQATMTRDFQSGMVPGLLQTAGYARAVFSCWPQAHNQNRIPAAIQGRMERQAALFDEGRQFQFVLLEQALWLTIASPDIMAAQFDRIGQLSELPNVDLRVIPRETRLDCCPLTPFVVLDSALVIVDLAASAVNLRGTHDVANYFALFDRLSAASLAGGEAQEWLRGHGERYAKAMASR